MSVRVSRAELLTLGDIAIVPLTQGKIAIIDAEDAIRILRHRWHTHLGSGTERFYAARFTWINYTTQRFTLLHRDILRLNEDDRVFADHINGDSLDCRKVNLRIANAQMNTANSHKRGGTTSRYKGVSWYARGQRWQVHIMSDGRSRNLGFFDCEEDAARAYDKAARHYFGEFARVNFPGPGEQGCLR